MANGPVRRTPIGELGLSTGKQARLTSTGAAHRAGLPLTARSYPQREHDESLRFSARLRELLEKYPS